MDNDLTSFIQGCRQQFANVDRERKELDATVADFVPKTILSAVNLVSRGINGTDGGRCHIQPVDNTRGLPSGIRLDCIVPPFETLTFVVSVHGRMVIIKEPSHWLDAQFENVLGTMNELTTETITESLTKAVREAFSRQVEKKEQILEE